jgi:hypothetical protein
MQNIHKKGAEINHVIRSERVRRIMGSERVRRMLVEEGDGEGVLGGGQVHERALVYVTFCNAHDPSFLLRPIRPITSSSSWSSSEPVGTISITYADLRPVIKAQRSAVSIVRRVMTRAVAHHRMLWKQESSCKYLAVIDASRSRRCRFDEIRAWEGNSSWNRSSKTRINTA